MTITLRNLGVLKQAKFELGDLTIVCGNNNMGKTYATYALFGFLKRWQSLMKIEIADQNIDTLLKEGTTEIDLTSYLRQADGLLERCSKDYTQILPRILSANPANLKEARFRLSLAIPEGAIEDSFERKMGSVESDLFTISKSEHSNGLSIALLVDREKNTVQHSAIKKTIADAIGEIVFGPYLPRPFIASAERTGAATFRKELSLSPLTRLLFLGALGESFNKAEVDLSIGELRDCLT